MMNEVDVGQDFTLCSKKLEKTRQNKTFVSH